MSTTPRFTAATQTGAGFGDVTAHVADVMGHFSALYGEYWQSPRTSPMLKEMTRLRNARTTECGF
ncbi:MAG: hypothetical protein AAGI15_08675 [Pseudomonadota bacterium]